MATELDLSGKKTPPRKPRKPAARERSARKTPPRTAGDVRTQRERYKWPSAADHLVLLGAIFACLAAVTIYVAHLETSWAAWARAAPIGETRPDHSDALNQLHRWSAFLAGTFLAVFAITCVDRLVFRSVTLPEVVTNRPLPGREHIFEPMEPEIRAGMLRWYGAVYAAGILSATLVVGI